MKLAEILFEKFPTQPTLGQLVNEIDSKEITNYFIEVAGSNFVAWEKLNLIRMYHSRICSTLELKRLVVVKDGRVMTEPETVKDMVNNSMEGAIQYKKYIEIDYPEALKNVWYKGFEIELIEKDYIDFKGGAYFTQGVFFTCGQVPQYHVKDFKDQSLTLEFWTSLIKN